MLRFTSIAFLMFLFACQNQDAQQKVVWQSEVDALSSQNDKKLYLEKIYKELSSTYYILEQSKLINGEGSKKYIEQIRSLDKVKNEQFHKSEAYLNTHGYPRIMELGGMAAYAPYYAIINAPDLESRKQNFTYLYDAYVFGDITVDQFYDYLSGMYYLEKGTQFEYQPWVGSRNLIDDMMKELNLD